MASHHSEKGLSILGACMLQERKEWEIRVPVLFTPSHFLWASFLLSPYVPSRSLSKPWWSSAARILFIRLSFAVSLILSFSFPCPSLSPFRQSVQTLMELGGTYSLARFALKKCHNNEDEAAMHITDERKRKQLIKEFKVSIVKNENPN